MVYKVEEPFKQAVFEDLVTNVLSKEDFPLVNGWPCWVDTHTSTHIRVEIDMCQI
jgi:hypothetical protein